jgi:hypothetical protein
MKNELISSLPTPLAVPLASYDFGYEFGSEKDLRHLFTLVELSLMYVEYVLRAQSKDEEGLNRPEPMGMRIRQIRMLYERLASHGQMPMITNWNDRYYYEKLTLIVQTRNRWAHHQPDVTWKNNADLLSDSYDSLLEALSPLTNTHLLVMKLSSSGHPECYLLQGTKALFEPQRYRTVELPSDVEEFSLFAHNNVGTVSLRPFFRYRQGAYGENRIEFLSTLRNGDASYIDPLPKSGNDAIVLSDRVT